MPYDEQGNWTSVVEPVDGSNNSPAPSPTNNGHGILTAANALALVQKDIA